MDTKPVSSYHRYDLDWLRVLLILTVFVFHSMRFFDQEDWIVKNAVTSEGVQILITFISRWMMPAIFVVSGLASYYALRKRSAGKFLQDRSLRLLVPLVVGIFTHVTWQVYLNRTLHGEFTGSYWQWLPSYFNGLDKFGGNFSWYGNHLWYLEWLFLVSLICLPLFIWLMRGAGARVLAWLGQRLSSRRGIYLPILVTMLLLVTLNPDGGVITSDDFGGWSFPNYLFFFLMGFIFASSESVLANIRRMRWISLIVGVVFTLVGGAMYAILGTQAFGTALFSLLNAMAAVIGWGWMLAILGFGLERLNFRTPFLDYANEAVLPFYILHQTILLTVGYFVVTWPLIGIAKWAIIAVVSFGLSMVIYEFLVRRVNVMRILFGMKPLPRPKSQVVEPAVAGRV